MKIRSPTSNIQQTAVDGEIIQWCVWTVSNVFLADDVEQISGKIDSISLSGAPGSLSDCISLSLDMQQQQPSLFGQVSVETLREVSLVLRCVLGWGGEESVVQARSKDCGPWIRLSCCASCSGITISPFIDFFISLCHSNGLLHRDALLRLQRCRPSWTPLIRAPTWLVDIRCKTVPKSTSSTETDVGVIPDLWSFLLLLALEMTNRILFSIHNLCICLFRSCQFYESFCLKSIFSILTASMTSSTVVNWAKLFFR